MPRRGFRFVGEVSAWPGRMASVLLQQIVRFCRTSDGVHLAVATAGRGTPLVKAANWLNHIEFDWQSPVWSPLFSRLAAQCQLVRYDERGTGLSDRDVAEMSFEAFVNDLETAVDECGLERFALLGISQGAPVSIAYAVRHPERVSRLILCGGFARGWRKRGNPAECPGRGLGDAHPRRLGTGQSCGAPDVHVAHRAGRHAGRDAVVQRAGAGLRLGRDRHQAALRAR